MLIISCLMTVNMDSQQDDHFLQIFRFFGIRLLNG